MFDCNPRITPDTMGLRRITPKALPMGGGGKHRQWLTILCCHGRTTGRSFMGSAAIPFESQVIREDIVPTNTNNNAYIEI